MDERMHTTPWFHATNLPNVRPENLVQIGIGGWQVPRVAVSEMVKRKTNIFTMQDLEELGIDKVRDCALGRCCWHCHRPRQLSAGRGLLCRVGLPPPPPSCSHRATRTA